MSNIEFFKLHQKYDSLKTRERYKLVWHYVLDVYPLYLESKRHILPKLLEIGVWTGGSVKAMHDYFPNTKIIGVDVDLERAKKHGGLPDKEKFPRITLVKADQSNAEQMKELGEKHGPFPAVIDDAGHLATSQIACFEALWPYVAPGGVYFIEDVNLSHKRSHDAFDYFKAMVDFDSFVVSGPYRVDHETTSSTPLIGSISFYQGMIVIRKTPELVKV